MLPALTVLACVVLRLVPHPPNLSPMGATAVFAGRTLPWRWALLLTLGAMFLGDAALATLRGHALLDATTPFVYAGLVTQLFLGRALRKVSGGALAAAGLGGIAFFLLSNLGVFLTSGMYPRSVAGLTECYALALPFLGTTLLGDLALTAALTLAYRPLAARLSTLGRGWVPVPAAELSAL